MIQGSGNIVKDIYSRDVIEKYTRIKDFYEAFRVRESITRDPTAGKIASKKVIERIMNWVGGVF